MMEKKIHLSIVSPVYQAENLLDELADRILKQASLITDRFELVLVEDGSRDGSWEKIKENCLKEARIKGIRLSRNFGQHSAIAAGIEISSGEWIVVLDCDLQDLPEEIPALYRKAQEGYDIVQARRIERKDTLQTKMVSKVFYFTLSRLSGVKYDSAVANFGIYHRKAIDSMLLILNSVHYFPSMVKWVGFKQTSIPVDHRERPRGQSSYNFSKKLKLGLNIIVAYSDKLLRFAVGFGILISLIAFLFALRIIYYALSGSISVSGYSSIVVLISFFFGAMIFVLGILGLYIGKIFESKKPSYLIQEKYND